MATIPTPDESEAEMLAGYHGERPDGADPGEQMATCPACGRTFPALPPAEGRD